jgi:Methyltransferase domain
MSSLTQCRLCGDFLVPVFRKVLLSRYDVQYFQCSVCRAMQTERPYWLTEAYLQSNERFDTGQVTRSIINAAFLSWLMSAAEAPSFRILDYGCGSGFLVRLLRDAVHDAWGLDSYSEPRLSSGFQVDDPSGFDVINLCEVVEHFDQPSQILDSIFASSPSIVVVQTSIMGEPDPSWPYLGDFHGQHIFFLTVETVHYIARRYQRYVCMISGFLLFMSEFMALKLLDPATGNFLNGMPAFNSEAARLIQAILATPYKYPLIDLENSMKSIRP